jgi:hypothetical protein
MATNTRRRNQTALILTFSQTEKEPLPLPLGQSRGDSEVFIFRNLISGIRNYLVTLIFPPNPRAFTFRSYIDSAKTGGTTKFPRLHDLI